MSRLTSLAALRRHAPLVALVATCVFAGPASAATTLPVNTYKSFRVVTPSFTDRFLRHQGGMGVTGIINTASSTVDRLDGTFLITRGLADGNCYSLQANNYPGRYLRHKNGAVTLGERSTDQYQAIFDQDATFCATAGLSGSGVSLQSKNFPGKYLRHRHGQVVLTDKSVGSYSFAQDATWQIAEPLTDRVPVAYPVPGKSSGQGVLPVSVAAVSYVGEISSSRVIPRDVGFSGVVNGQIVWTFADTLRADQAFCATSSAALGNFEHPLQVTDKDLRSNGCPAEWIPFFGKQVEKGASRWANWVTNVIEYAPNKGLVWFNALERNTTGCTGWNPCHHGAGIATVTADENGAVAVRTTETVWNGFEPVWGNAGVAFEPRDGYIYVFGRGPHTEQTVYLARALPADVMKAEKYQYFDNSTKTWGNTRFTDDGRFGTVAISDKQALFTYNSVDQTTPFWSNHYNTWMMVYGDHWGKSNIHVMTAPRLEGPWVKSESISIDTCPTSDCSNDQQLHYAVAGHPEFDPSGRTVLVTWSTWGDNRIYAKRITWR